MIFSQYRDSVQEITACLHSFKPLIKVMEFVGQAGNIFLLENLLFPGFSSKTYQQGNVD